MKIITVESFTGATYGEERTFRIGSEQQALAKAFGGKPECWLEADISEGAGYKVTVRGCEPRWWKRG